MTKVAIVTLGCKVNQYESDAVANELTNLGYEVSQKLEFADYYILNTCAVTNASERKSRQLIARALKYNENANIIVMGCASENDAKQFLERKEVVAVYGVAGKHLIPKLLNQMGNFVQELPNIYEDNYKITIPKEVRATLKVQDGCNNYCAYCLIPYLRGNSRSRPLESILEEAETLSQTAKELVVTGINTSDYQINGELALDRLMRSLRNIPARIRISSLEVNIITQKLLQVLAELPNFAPHFHLSLQSGSNQTLKDMERKYTVQEFLEAVQLIRTYFQNPAITTDLIVGFPTETDENFTETLETLQKVNFFDIHVFPYSSRNGTKAEKLGELSGTIVQERLKQVQELKKQGFTNYLTEHIGVEKIVLIENEFEGLLFGHTENYIKVYLAPIESLKIGEFYKVTLISIFKDGMIGKYKG